MVSPPMRIPFSQDLWLALLREPQTSPNLGLRDESPDHPPRGPVDDIWKGIYRREPVYIKVIRTQDPVRLRAVESVSGSFISAETYSMPRFILKDTPLCGQLEQGESSPERAPRR